MKTVRVKVPSKCYHAATGLLLESGEMVVTDQQAETLGRAGFLASAETPESSDVPPPRLGFRKKPAAPAKEEE